MDIEKIFEGISNLQGLLWFIGVTAVLFIGTSRWEELKQKWTQKISLYGRKNSKEVQELQKLWYQYEPQPPINQEIQRLNKIYENHAALIGQISHKPILYNDGPLTLNPDMSATAKANAPQKNEPHGILYHSTPWNLSRTEFNLRYRTLDYASIQVLRKHGAKPPIISAGGILCCPEKDLLYIHERSSIVATYPSACHIFGGNYLPPQEMHPNDDDDLIETIARELNEETKSRLFSSAQLDQAQRPLTMSFELTTGFVQFTRSICITPEMTNKLQSSKEGTLRSIHFENIKDTMLTPNYWVPSGQMLILWWLAQGAPIQNNGWAFKTKERARELYECLIEDETKIRHSWKQVKTKGL